MNYIYQMQFSYKNNNNQPLQKVTKSLYIVTDLGQLPFMLFTQMARTWAVHKGQCEYVHYTLVFNRLVKRLQFAVE